MLNAMMRSGPLIVAFANFKGGSGKTTSAAYLAHALHEQGKRVLVVDADPLGVLTQWEGLSADPWPFSVVQLPTTTVHKDLPGVIGRQRYDAVVIDTPGNVVQKEITLSAMQAATDVVVPIAPSRLEEMLLSDVVELANQSAAGRPDRAPPHVVLMINRAVANTNLLTVYMEHYPKFGLEVFPSIVTSRQMYVAAAGENINNASSTAYGDLASYLTDGK
jgi:chromosome partitioning protein